MIPVTKTAILGAPGSFHEAAAFDFLGETIQTISCFTFREIFESVQKGEADYGVLAIQNLVSGSIAQNFGLLMDFPDIKIIAERWLKVDQNLLALPGQEIKDIHLVISHPVALEQCSGFFKAHPGLRTETRTDTASSAAEISENNLQGTAAIAGRNAAVRYGLSILKDSIANLQENFTRFLLLQKHSFELEDNSDKVSLIFQLPDAEKRLYDLIAHLSPHLIKITQFQYIQRNAADENLVFIDFEVEEPWVRNQFIHQLKEISTQLHIKGFYQKSNY